MFLKSQVKKKISKLLKVNRDLDNAQYLFYSFNSSLLPRQGSVSRVRNRCVYTGRSRNILKFVSSSRFVFRGLANSSKSPTVKRYSR